MKPKSIVWALSGLIMEQNYVWLMLAPQNYGEFYCPGRIRLPIAAASEAKAIELSGKLANCPVGMVSVYRLPVQGSCDSVYVSLAETNGRYHCGCNCTWSDCGCQPCDDGRYALPHVSKTYADAAAYTAQLVAQHEKCLIPVPKTKIVLLNVAV